MNTTYTIFKDIGIALISAGLTWFIAIKVQFAKDEKTAMVNAKSFIFKLVAIFLNGFIAYSLITEFISSEPLTKKSLFFILLYSFALFYALISTYITKLADLQRRQIEAAGKYLESQEKLLENHQKHLEITKELATKMENKKK